MARWAKLDERISEDIAVADLLADNPLAIALFAMSLPRADVYGILPGDARSFRARVCPAAELTQAQVAAAIISLCDAGLYHAYIVNGRSYIYVRRFHRYQEVRWNRVGPPEHPLPECWEEPAGYAGPAGDCRTSPGPVPDESRTSPGPVPDQSGLARAPVDTDTEVVTDSENVNTLARACAHVGIAADAAPADPVFALPVTVNEDDGGNGQAKPKRSPKADDPISVALRELQPGFSAKRVRDYKALVTGALVDPNQHNRFGTSERSELLPLILQALANAPPETTTYPDKGFNDAMRAYDTAHGRGGQTWNSNPRRYQPAYPTGRQPGVIED